MPTIKVVKAFNLLTATNAKPQRFEVGEHEVSDEIAGHWYVQPHLEQPEPAEPKLDPATATRDELVAFLQAGFLAHLVECSDDDLRAAVFRVMDSAEQPDEGEADAPAQPAPTEDVAKDAAKPPADDGNGQETGAADIDPAARKAQIREQLKAMSAELPHHNASLDKHEAALAAATASADQAQAQTEIQPDPAAGQGAAETAAA